MDKISFNVKSSELLDRLNKQCELTGKKKTAVLNQILEEYYSSQDAGFEAGALVEETIRKIELLIYSQEINVSALRKEIKSLSCMIFRS